MTSFYALAIDSTFFANSTNLPHKTLETDESEAKEVEKKSSEFVEFGRQFVRKIRQIRLYISAVG